MIISQTPLRISFVGGGTDFESFYRQYPGKVLSTAIDKYFYITVNPRFDGKLKISYSETELVNHSSQVKHPLVKAALEETGIETGIDIVSLSDIPAYKTGLGLGSSSSFTVGLLNCLYEYLGQKLSPSVLAEKACEIEIERAGSPIGKQDQYAAAFGGLNVINFNTNGEIEVSPVLLNPRTRQNFEKHLLVFFTGKERSANLILSEQKQNIEKKIDSLKKMSDMVPVLMAAIGQENFKKVGEILHENWMLKKDLSQGVSNPHIDAMYETALKAGAFGGKILGAGGGGFLLVIAPLERHQKIKEVLSAYTLTTLHFSDVGSRIVFKN